MDRTGSRLPADEWYLENWNDAVRAGEVQVFAPVTRQQMPTEPLVVMTRTYRGLSPAAFTLVVLLALAGVAAGVLSL